MLKWIFSYRKLPFKFSESINLILSVIILSLLFITGNKSFLYGGISLILASTLSIFIIRILPLNFESIEIHILQFHIFICIFLGTTLDFYILIHQFDFFLHLNFGVVACILALPFVRCFLPKLKELNSSSLLIFVVVFIFCFSVCCGAM